MKKKRIAIVEIKAAIKRGEISVIQKDGMVLLKDNATTEVVCIAMNREGECNANRIDRR